MINYLFKHRTSFSLISLIFLFNSCAFKFKELNNSGFGGGNWNRNYVNQGKEEKLSNFIPNTKESVDTSVVQYQFQIVENPNGEFTLNKSIQTKKLNTISLFDEKKKLLFANTSNQSNQNDNDEIPNENWKTVHKVLFTLSLLLIVAGILILISPTNSGNYFQVGMAAGVIIFGGLILMITSLFKSAKARYLELGFWGKLGVWLMLLGVVTFGITIIIGFPMWIYGLSTGN